MRPDEIVRKILEVRGIVSEEDIREFLSDRPQLAHDPLSLPGMEAGADFLYQAFSRKDRICVYGDYDVDGVCGTALLVLFLREASRLIGQDVQISYYIPSRIEEGYGLNKNALRAIKDMGADVVVTVDCGSVSMEEVSYAREIGLNILITDHHDPDPARLPDCILINPKVGASDTNAFYPFPKLSGAGVAFKLCGALLKRFETDPVINCACETRDAPLRALHTVLREQIDLVCIATIADVMPLVDENRTFVKYGLARIQKTPRPALRALLAVSGIEYEHLTARDVAFAIAPRINALGRLTSASDGVRFFLMDDAEEIRRIAERMDACNKERRRIQEDCFQECMGLCEADKDAGGSPKHLFLLLSPEGSHEGVAGIVAGKVREATGLPCAVLTKSQDDGGMLKGSARSAGKLDITALLKQHEKLLEQFGGHAAAAGFRIRAENEDLLRRALSADLACMLAEEPDLLAEKEEPELALDTGDVTLELAGAIRALAPFGNGNPLPRILLRAPADRIAGIRRMGQDDRHLRFTAEGLPCIFFGGGDTVFPDEGFVGIIGCPEINEWRGTRSIQLAVSSVNML